MSCKSALYAANTASQTALEDASINFGSVVRRFGNNINLDGGNVVVSGSGYYDIDVNIGFTATSAATTISLYKDGTAIPGATVSLATTAGTTYAVTIPAIIRQVCCCEAAITAKISLGTVTNAAIAVEKI